MFHIAWDEMIARTVDLTRDEALGLLVDLDVNVDGDESDEWLVEQLKLAIEPDPIDGMEYIDSSRWSEGTVASELTLVEARGEDGKVTLKNGGAKHTFSSPQARLNHLRQYRERVGKAAVAEQEQRQGEQPKTP